MVKYGNVNVIGGEALSVEARTGVVPRDHVVQFYEHDDELAASVAQFLIDGLGDDEIAIVVATPTHTAAFYEAVARGGVDVGAVRTSGRLIVADAAQMLSRQMVAGRPDANAFATEIGGLVRRALETGRRVRIYGEMVALLWDAGNVEAAIELESLWNDLGRLVPFSLFCAYHVPTVADDELGDSFRRVCHLHSAIVANPVTAANPADVAVVARGEDVRSFPCQLHAPSAARHFVADTLTVWGRESLVADASIVVAELATNAVVHARSEFIVAVSSQNDCVRLSVRDASVVLPTVRDPGPHSISGRGLMLVATIARRWGIELITDGKVVWAELGDP